MIDHAVRPRGRVHEDIDCAARCGNPLTTFESHTANGAEPGSVVHYHPDCCPVCPHDRSGGDAA